MGKKKYQPADTRAISEEVLVDILQLWRSKVHECEEVGVNNRIEHLNRYFRRMCSDLLWFYSEADGAKEGCLHWSAEALAIRDAYGKDKPAGGDALQHEHAFPRHQLINKLLQEGTTKEAVADLLRKYNIGIVVSAREHELLPKRGTDDPLERYLGVVPIASVLAYRK